MTSKINGLSPIRTTHDVAAASSRRTDAARSEAPVGAGDSVELTPSGRALGENGADAPVDTARVDRLRQSIADGSYRVDADRIAGRLLDVERTHRKG
jgi:negative regulator of flagellin synthesis FlgM